MSKKHRLFFALEPSPRVRTEIHAVQERLNGSGRAILPQQFHITLAFLGMQESVLIPKLCAIAAQVPLAPCTLVLDRPGNFRRSKVLWLGASTIPDALSDFRRALVQGIETAGIEFDQKAWKIHLTLYRGLRKPPHIMETVPVTWPLNGFSLIESVSVKNGVEYHRQARWNTRLSVD